MTVATSTIWEILRAESGTALEPELEALSDEALRELRGLGIEVDASDRQEPDDWGGGESHRYIAVSE